MVLVDKAYIEARFGVSSHLGQCDPSPLSSISKRPKVGSHDETSTGPESSFEEAGDSGERTLAWKKLLRLLSVRDRSVRECRNKLEEAGFSCCEIDKAIQKALRLSLLDDARFADCLVRSKVSAGKGLAGIEALLAEHDVSPGDLDGFPETYVDGLGSELDRACRYIEKHPTRSKNPWKSAYGKLVRAGFDLDSAYRASSWWAKGLNDH